MEKKLTYELINAVKQEKGSIEVILHQCEQLQTSILKTLESSKSATLKNDNVETILLYHRGQMEVETCKDLVKEMKKTYNSASVRHVINPGKKNIEKDTRLNLRKIVVEKQPRLPGGTVYLPTPLSECGVKEILDFCIETPLDSADCDETAVVYLPDGNIVVGDWFNSKLKLYTVKGQFLDELKFEGDLGDMCMVDKNTVAVAVSRPGSVYVVNMKSSKLSLLYSIEGPDGKDCHGVTHRDGKFVVSTPKQVYSMTRDGKSELLTKLPENCFSLTSDPKHGHIYVSQFTDTTGDTAVYRLSGEKKKAIMKVCVVKFARGIDVDMEGNVYVCGLESHNIVQMSADGTNVRELLTSSDRVAQPHAIAVCGDKFVVTFLGYDLNYVKVYQMS